MADRPDWAPYFLYRHYDAQDRLLYVGQTRTMESRWAAHACHSNWYEHVATITLETFDNLEDVRKAERIAIEDEKPLLNRELNYRLTAIVDDVGAEKYLARQSKRDNRGRKPAHAFTLRDLHFIASCLTLYGSIETRVEGVRKRIPAFTVGKMYELRRAGVFAEEKRTHKETEADGS